MIRFVTFVAVFGLSFAAVAQTPGLNGSTASQPVGGSSGGATAFHRLSTASTNAVAVKAAPGNVYQMIAINTTSTIYYLKFYDKATTPTCNTDTVVMTLPVPVGTSASGGGFAIPVPVGAAFVNGISICLTGGIADNDNTNAATGVAIDLLYN